MGQMLHKNPPASSSDSEIFSMHSLFARTESQSINIDKVKLKALIRTEIESAQIEGARTNVLTLC